MADEKQDPIEQGLHEIIADYLTADESGRPLDRQAWLAAHPEFADELREFLDDHERLLRAVRCQHPTGDSSRPIDGEPGETIAWEMPGIIHPAGSMIAHYEIIKELDRGGMGIVFRARDTRLDRQVALKMIRAGELATQEEIDRFLAEAQAAAGLEHPGIVPVYDVGEFQGRQYIAMRLIDGETLAARLRRGPLPVRQAALLVRKIATAVEFAHRHGVIHRDLKPANILLDQGEEPLITDFGLAKRLESNKGLTLSGQILGTPAFMAPEQATGALRETNELADVYALGAILYALCTGSAPFEASNQVDLLLQVIDREPALPRKRNGSIPRELERIILRALEKDPRRRFPSSAALAADLDHFLKDEPLETPANNIVQSACKWARREPALVSHLAGITAVMVIVSIASIGFELHYALRHLGVLVVWLAASFGLQQLLHRPDTANLARFLWSAADVLFATVLLYNSFPPRAPLYLAYPLMIAASGLFGRVRLVVFTTVAAMVGFSTLVVLTNPEEPQKLHYCAVFAVGLVVTGLVVGIQVRRLRALNRYFDALE